ncbi:MAG: ribbon-helix-helix domain-containing protein [Halobacteria archaeon]
MSSIQARVSQDLEDEVDRLVESGLYENRSEVVREALRKMIAQQKRETLSELTERMRIEEGDLLEELRSIRDE